MLTIAQVTALTAQAAKAADIYPSRDSVGNLLDGWQLNDDGIPVYTGTELSRRGIGIYGQTTSGLILTGYLKPATLNLIVSPDMTATVLNTPAVWTGQYGIDSLLTYLNSSILQNISQVALLAGSYQGLLDTGYLNGDEDARYIATLIQPAAQYGVTAVIDWIEGRTQPDFTTKIEIAARQGQYAIDFITVNAPQLIVAPELGGFINTVSRESIDSAVTEIIGNTKISPIEYADVVATLVERTKTVDEEGIFRFAPGAPRG
jgi:hypothetical protein